MLNTVNANEETKQLNIQIDNFLSEIKSIRHNLLSDIIGSISILDINDANEVIKNVELLRNCNFSDYITIHQSQPSAANRFSILSEIEKAGENWRENNRSLNLNRYTFRIFSSNMSGKGSPSKDEGKGAEGYSWSVTDLQTKLMKFIDFQEKVESYPVQLDALKANVDNNTAKVDSIAVEVKHLAGVTTGISNKFDQHGSPSKTSCSEQQLLQRSTEPLSGILPNLTSSANSSNTATPSNYCNYCTIICSTSRSSCPSNQTYSTSSWSSSSSIWSRNKTEI